MALAVMTRIFTMGLFLVLLLLYEEASGEEVMARPCSELLEGVAASLSSWEVPRVANGTHLEALLQGKQVQHTITGHVIVIV